MKIPLDECLPVDFRRHLSGHQVHTAQWAGFKSLKNGQLPKEAERAGYDVFLTMDQDIPAQQNPARRKIAVLIVQSRTNQMEDLLPKVDPILAALVQIQPGQTMFAS